MSEFLNIIKVRYLLTVILLTFIICPVLPDIIQDADSVHNVPDTIQGADSVHNAAAAVQNADSARVTTRTIQNTDSVYNAKRTITAEEIIRGERLFFGLIRFDDKTIDCAGCHNLLMSDTLNWNPDAVEISSKYRDRSARDLSIVLLKPAGKKLAEVHKGFNLTPEDIIMIKAYMDRVVLSGLIKNKPVITNLILFIAASLLFLLSMVDLIITKWLKMQWINLLILLVTTVYLTWSLVIDAIDIGRSRGYSPDQPVKFSHAIHAGQNGTSCIYCHSYAPYSKTAGIPPENVCMNCHLLVRSGSRTGAFEIAKILDAYENKKPIGWVKVHNLPDHVFFSHAQHVAAGGVACTECHGDVGKMNRITQVADLAMGWCINCHRTRKVKFEEDIFYSQYRELKGDINKGALDSVTVEKIGGTQCMKCHY